MQFKLSTTTLTSGEQVYSIRDDQGRQVATVNRYARDPEHVARLLAAAAEMRDLLSFMVEEFAECHTNNMVIEHMDDHGDPIKLHQAEEPDCTYCANIAMARALLFELNR